MVGVEPKAGLLAPKSPVAVLVPGAAAAPKLKEEVCPKPPVLMVPPPNTDEALVVAG